MKKLDLSLGTMNEGIKTLHASLQQRRFHIPQDEVARGYFGPGTRQAVMQFQRHNTLAITGIVDERTTVALGLVLGAEVSAGEPMAGPAPECCDGESPSPLDQPGDGVNETCPWSGRPIHPGAMFEHQGRRLGFCSQSHRDKFARAIEHFASQKALPLESKTCPWSGRRVRPNATLTYDGQVVGFCSPAHRDQFKAALDHFASPAAAMPATAAGADSMTLMEKVADTIFVPPLVDETVLARFCKAVQTYADSQSLNDAAAEKLAELQFRLSNLRNMASLARLAVVGHPLSFARLEDELHCLAVDFPCDELKPDDEREGLCPDTPDQQVFLSAAVDLFAGATFLWKDDVARRDRAIAAIVRAIEDAIAFPVTYAAEAATFLGLGTIALSPTHAAIVIGNATQRLIQRDRACTPRAPADIRRRLEGLACTWMQGNPVTAFFEAIRGPKIRRIVRWQTDLREEVSALRVGDPVVVVLHSPRDEDDKAGACQFALRDYGVMFTPRQPATDAIVVDDCFEVKVPAGSRTGPVIVVPKVPDFTGVIQLLTNYQQRYPDEINASVFALARIDTWAFPIACRHPCVMIAPVPASATATAFTASGPLAAGQTVSVGETVSIQYQIEPPGAEGGESPMINAPGGSVTRTARPDVLLFHPSAPGNTTVELTWGSTTVVVPISVV
jgi:peptidoglycan hydrolase-like protein with peptidoglycan-binding domain